MAYHGFVRQLPGGFIGVDVFFVLSGFLITALLLDEWSHRRTVWLVGFYVRRALRLMPALAAFLVAFIVYAALFQDRQFLVVVLRWIPFVYLTNVMTAFGRGYVGHGHIWSLAAEEQFYLVWPPVLLLLLRSHVSRRVIVTVTAIATAASGATAAMLWLTGSGWVRVYYGPDTHAMPILAGCLLGELWVWGYVPTGAQWSRTLARTGAVGVVLLGVGTLTLRPPMGLLYVGGYGVVTVCAASVILAVMQSPGYARLWQGRRLVRTGQLSYALYLFHPLLLEMLGPKPSPILRLAALAATFPVAAASMRWIEGPCLERKRRFAELRV